MFITKEELRSAIYSYQLDQITEEDNSIVLMAINSAVEEARSYLRPTEKKEWNDGRTKYDVQAVFSATGNDRNPLLVEMVKSIAVWYVIRLCNADIIYETVKDRYDRAIDWLKKVNKGDISLELPIVQETTDNTNKGLPFRSGSREKFNHE
jgi:Protein of unknown function (DUF1320)